MQSSSNFNTVTEFYKCANANVTLVLVFCTVLTVYKVIFTVTRVLKLRHKSFMVSMLLMLYTNYTCVVIMFIFLNKFYQEAHTVGDPSDERALNDDVYLK